MSFAGFSISGFEGDETKVNTATITIKLHRDVDENEWYLDKVEVQNGNVKTVTSFLVSVPMKEAFDASVHAYLMRQLPVRSELAVCSIENCVFPDLDLVLHDLRIIAQRAFANKQAVTIRSKGSPTDVVRLYAKGFVPGSELLTGETAGASAPSLDYDRGIE